MIKFLHAADLHLDAPFTGGGAERRQEQRQMLEELFELASAETCDLLLLPGDLFDGATVYPETLTALRRALESCKAEVFIAPGNHDCVRRGSPYLTAEWPENVHVFTKRSIEAVELRDLGCRVYGAGFCNRYEDGLLSGFAAQADGLLNLMVLHGDVVTPESPYNAIAKVTVAASGLDYLALGHIHARSELLKAGETFYAWPGCPMGRGFDETGEKGVYIGTLEKGDCRLAFRPLSGRRYEILTVRVDGDALQSVLAQLPEGTERDIYRIVLTGESAPIDVRALEAALAPRFFALTVRDRTEPTADLWAGAGENTLRGQYLAKLQALLETADAETRRTALLAAKLGANALDGKDEVLAV